MRTLRFMVHWVLFEPHPNGSLLFSLHFVCLIPPAGKQTLSTESHGHVSIHCRHFPRQPVPVEFPLRFTCLLAAGIFPNNSCVTCSQSPQKAWRPAAHSSTYTSYTQVWCKCVCVYMCVCAGSGCVGRLYVCEYASRVHQNKNKLMGELITT